jgi:GPH family glycoside/pentoside/hexuronide:cation symporter
MEQNKLPLKIKLGYGICDLGGNLIFTIMGFYLLIFLTDTLKLAAGLAGTAIMIGKLWDAVTDPPMGHFSDKTRTKWGRRRPFMFIGAILMFLFMIVLFINPGIKNQTMLFIWVAIVYCLLNTAYTMVNIPYGALTPDLTGDYNERTSLNGYRMIFAVIGTFLGAGLVLPLVTAFQNPDTGWPVMGMVMGAFMMVSALLTVLLVKEPPVKHVVKKINLIQSYLGVFKVKPFLLMLFPWALHITGINIIQSVLLYYFTYIYGAKDLFIFALVSLLTGTMIFIPIWVKISKRLGKKWSYNLGMGIFILAVMLFFFFGQQLGAVFAFITMFIAGIGFATQYVMPWALLPDVVEYDYAENGVRREGIFYGMMTFTSKVGQALALFLNGWLLSLFGYQPDAPQTETAKLGIKIIAGPLPAVFFVVGILILAFYPISEKVFKEIMRKNSERDAQAPSE